MCPNTIVDFGCAAGAGATPPPGDDGAGAFVSTVAVGPAPRTALAPGDVGERPGPATDGAFTGEPAVFDEVGTESPPFEAAVSAAPAGTPAGAAVGFAGAE